MVWWSTLSASRRFWVSDFASEHGAPTPENGIPAASSWSHTTRLGLPLCLLEPLGLGLVIEWPHGLKITRSNLCALLLTQISYQEGLSVTRS